MFRSNYYIMLFRYFLVFVLGPENTHLLHKGEVSLNGWPSVLTSLALTKQVHLLLIQQNQISWIQTNKRGGQLYIDISPYEESEYSLHGN